MKVLSIQEYESEEHINDVELSTIIVGMEMLVVTRGGMTSPYCQYRATGRGDMKILQETDDTNDHDDTSVA